MSKMTTAARAGDFNPAQTVRVVLVFLDHTRVGGNDEAWPSAARVEFGPGKEEQRSAARAVVVSGLVILSQGAGEWALSAFFTQDAILLVVLLFAPLRITVRDFVV